MTQDILGSLFSGKARLAVLRRLYQAPEGLTGREAARLAGFSHQQAHNELRQLAALGIVSVQRAGAALLFRLNSKNWLAGVLEMAFKKEKEWLGSLLKDASTGLPACVESLVLYGSAAAGALRPGSDIDLLAIVARPADKKAALAYFSEKSALILERYNLPLSPLVLTSAEFSGKYRQNDDFAREVLKRGRVIKGKRLTELL